MAPLQLVQLVVDRVDDLGDVPKLDHDHVFVGQGCVASPGMAAAPRSKAEDQEAAGLWLCTSPSYQRVDDLSSVQSIVLDLCPARTLSVSSVQRSTSFDLRPLIFARHLPPYYVEGVGEGDKWRQDKGHDLEKGDNAGQRG